MPDIKGFASLFADVNKIAEGSKDSKEGIASAGIPELDLPMSDKELLDLKKKWEKAWSAFEPKITGRQKKNEEYWLGKIKQADDDVNFDKDKPNHDNVIFEALETFIPLATQKNPEPIVEADNTELGNKLADRVSKMLTYLADVTDLKLSIKQVVRYWSLYFLGVMKLGYSMENEEIAMQVVRPQRLKLDPDATIINGEYTGEFIGEVKRDPAHVLAFRFPKKKDYIEEAVKGEMSTSINYTEWWSDKYVFWTFGNEVLGKMKNPHWNYEIDKKVMDPMGNVSTVKSPQTNHFPVPKKPYVFLSVFNLGEHPFDDTNLIHQNQSAQDRINKRLKQIDRNADNTNGGIAVSGDHFSKEQAEEAARAKQRGEAIWVPHGSVAEAYQMDVGPPLPAFVYEDLVDSRNEMKSNFGIRGVAPTGTFQEKTVRGKQMAKSQDLDRIGGGITEYIEQFTDHVFNWMIQLMYVYYTEKHTATIIGEERAREFITLSKQDFGPRLYASVKAGSMIPKDPMSERNQAVELWGAGAIDLISLYEKLEFPNPRESAKRMFMWTMVQQGKAPPQIYFGADFMQPPQGQAPPGLPGQPPPGAPPGGVQAPTPANSPQAGLPPQMSTPSAPENVNPMPQLNT